MCSTVQSPRAANAFSRACAARTWPAPDEADKRRTRGFDFIRAALEFCHRASRSLATTSGNFLKHSARHVLQLAKTRQVVLKFVVQHFRLFRAKLRAQNHIAQPDGMRQKRVFLQFFERNARVVVIHNFPRGETSLQSLRRRLAGPINCTREELRRTRFRRESKSGKTLRSRRGSGHEFVTLDF